MNGQTKIVFVGAGRLATNLSQALKQQGFDIVQIYSRTAGSAQRLASLLGCAYTTSTEGVLPDADVYIYALCDHVLEQIAHQIMAPDAVHLHTAGSMEMSVLGDDKPHKGVLYPFQSFSLEQLVDFRHVPVLIEAGDEKARTVVTKLAHSLSEKVYEADMESRGRLHLAGVFANNFANCMYAIAEEQLHGTDLPFDLLLPLIKQTADKVATMSPRKAQTGPAVRHDNDVMQRHLSLLRNPDEKEIYRLISNNIQNHEN